MTTLDHKGPEKIVCPFCGTTHEAVEVDPELWKEAERLTEGIDPLPDRLRALATEITDIFFELPSNMKGIERGVLRVAKDLDKLADELEEEA
jgi:hypothetical protein